MQRPVINHNPEFDKFAVDRSKGTFVKCPFHLAFDGFAVCIGSEIGKPGIKSYRVRGKRAYGYLLPLSVNFFKVIDEHIKIEFAGLIKWWKSVLLTKAQVPIPINKFNDDFK